MQRLSRAGLVLVLVAASCGGATGPSPVASSPAPPASPSPGPFSLEVLPPEAPTANRMAIPGSRYALLVRADAADGDTSPVTVSATATKASVLAILPASLVPGEVGEVWVVADATTQEASGSVAITASRGGITRTETRTLPVFPMPDDRAGEARPYFERWVAWLAEAQPELGITTATDWEPVFASTLLVVSHYSYWSTDWEMTVAWHNMIPPYDWTDVFLRARRTETAPSIAFRIDSVSGQSPPHPIAPPDTVVR